MKQYRLLQPHEIIRAGDYGCSRLFDDLSEANVQRFAVTAENLGAIGKRADYCPNHHYRPVRQDNWISFEDRKPTKDDASKEGYVVVCKDDGAYLGFFVPEKDTRKDFTHWMPTAFVPREAPRVKVDGHEVVPQKDGSVKVGCQTVASTDFEEIIRQRQEVMKS